MSAFASHHLQCRTQARVSKPVSTFTIHLALPSNSHFLVCARKVITIVTDAAISMMMKMAKIGVHGEFCNSFVAKARSATALLYRHKTFRLTDGLGRRHTLRDIAAYKPLTVAGHYRAREMCAGIAHREFVMLKWITGGTVLPPIS